MNLVKDPETAYVNRLIKKYGKDLEILDGSRNFPLLSRKKCLNGNFSIKGIRKYRHSYLYNLNQTFYEIDLVLKGKLLAKWNSKEYWHGSEILKESGASKIKINRFIRRHISNDVNEFLLTFGVEAGNNLKIKKVEWV
jgi:hypothetical protein